MTTAVTTLIMGSAFFALFLGVAAVFGIVIVVALVLASDRSRILMVAVVATMLFPVHKKLGTLVLNTESGAPGLIVTSTMVVLAGLYIAWMVEGTFKRDVVRALRRPVFWTPLLAMFLASFSINAAQNSYLAISQLVYWLFIYALFLYFGARVHSRTDIAWILGAFGALAVIEAGVVVLQKVGIFGLGFLNVKTQAIARTTDVGDIGRPFGTLVHPVFLAITVSMIALVALSLAMFLSNKWVRLACLAVVLLCLGQIYLTQARGPLLGVIPALAVLIAIGATRHRISARAWVTGSFLVLAALIVLWPQVQTFYENNFGSSHFSIEVKSRVQLNNVGERMIDSSPLTGTGLNNFTQIEDRYTTEPLLFPGFPSHNLFILTAAETGVLGLAGLLIIGAALAWNAIQLGQSRDPLFRAIGWAMFCIIILNVIAEQLSYSMREEVPLTVFWIFAGLMMACIRMQEDERRTRRLASRREPGSAPRPSGAPAREPASVHA
jgi:O-Antigen ligase